MHRAILCLTLAALGTFPAPTSAQTAVRIDRPDVRSPHVEHLEVRFQPGDRVRVRGGGCAQTGGAGRTWKRYVDPQGPRAEWLYHARAGIPALGADLYRLSAGAADGLTFQVPASAPPDGLYLVLGYEDDDYSDNGYWGRDPGTGNQCVGQPDAFVEVVVDQGSAPPVAVRDCVGESAAAAVDADGDGLADRCEDLLARTFAPVVLHSANDPALPTNVDWFLLRTELWFYDDACEPDLRVRITTPGTQADLLGKRYGGGCRAALDVVSNLTLSIQKQRTFFLADVDASSRRGSGDPSDWTTYVHAYPNTDGGVTLQYWRFYAFNDLVTQHGGDWECTQVVLDAQLKPRFVDLLGHTSIERKDASAAAWIGEPDMPAASHPLIRSEPGGHASSLAPAGATAADIRQETWPGGRVTWPGRGEIAGGRLVNVGEKHAPLNGQVFIQYSGLWGSPGVLYATSGYWGPAFNETGMTSGLFLTAWCSGMAVVPQGECVPLDASR